jgi:hypothetical protein
MNRAMPLLLVLAACSDFPEVGRAEAKLATTATTPPLLTAEQLALVTGGGLADRSGALSVEAASLRARAAALRQR